MRIFSAIEKAIERRRTHRYTALQRRTKFFFFFIKYVLIIDDIGDLIRRFFEGKDKLINRVKRREDIIDRRFIFCGAIGVQETIGGIVGSLTDPLEIKGCYTPSYVLHDDRQIARMFLRTRRWYARYRMRRIPRDHEERRSR